MTLLFQHDFTSGPALSTALTVSHDPAGDQLADLHLGTLSPTPLPGSLPVREGLHFTPAWDVQEEARASEMFLGLSPEAALHEARMRTAQAARRRVLHGVTWRYERLTTRVTNAAGEVLACQSVSGLPSDLDTATRQGIELDLHQAALGEAQDWAVLGLN